MNTAVNLLPPYHQSSPASPASVSTLDLESVGTFSRRALPLHIPPSEIKLKPEPEHVGGPLQIARSVLDRVSEIAMQPEHVHLDILIPVPVQAQLRRHRLVRPEARVGKSRPENLLTEAQFADAAHDLPGAGTSWLAF